MTADTQVLSGHYCGCVVWAKCIFSMYSAIA